MTDSRAAALAVEALGDADPASRVAAADLEVLTLTTGISSRVAAVEIEALTLTTGIVSQLGAVMLEVLVPTALNTGYAGWGIKL